MLTEIVKKIALLRQSNAKTLLPTVDLFDFSVYFNKTVKCSQFFDYPIDHKFSAIVGFLPSVSHKHIQVKLSGFDKNTNLYIFYINKCLDHLDKFGELIVCTPSNFLKNAALLNQKLYAL